MSIKRMDAFQDTVLELQKKFKEVWFYWIPREQNAIADKLANETEELPDDVINEEATRMMVENGWITPEDV